MQNTCYFCHQPTNHIYRNEKNHDKDSNKLACCQACAESKNADQEIPYLTISLILKPKEN